MGEETFNKLCDISGINFCMLNSEMQITAANDVFTDKYIGEKNKSILDIIHPDERSKVKSLLVSQKNHNIFRTVLKDINNNNNTVVIYYSNKDSNLSCIIAEYIADITELVVQKKIQLFTIAIEQSPSSVIITDSNGNIEYVNPKFSELTGYSQAEVLGKNPNILKSGAQSRNFYKNMWDTLKRGEEWRGEFHNKKKNGDLYWEIASISPVSDESGEISHYVAVKEDITERKNAEQALKKSEENLRKRNEEIERELAYAQIIVKRLLPQKPPLLDHLRLSYRYHPVDAIGGDIYSFTEYNKNDLGIFLGDVVGHGVSAALFLALVKSTSEKIGSTHWDKPSLYLEQLNSEIINSISEYFITALYAFFKYTGDGYTMSFARAGHPPPILLKSQKNEVQYLKTQGKPLGFFHDVDFQEISIDLSAGDRVFLYTDGLNETYSKSNKMLDYEGLVDIVNDTQGLSLDEQLDSIIVEVNNYRESSKADDDIVLIGVEII